MSRAHSFAANMASRQRRSKVWLYFTQKDDHRATCSACKTSLSSKGAKTTITPKHLSILHAITLQACRVFERYGVKITLMNLNQATAARLTLALHPLILKVNSNSIDQRSSTGGPRPPGGPRRYCRGSAKLFHLKHFFLFQKLKTSNS